MWDFSTEPDFQERLDWMSRFVREEVEPLDQLWPDMSDPYDMGNRAARRIVKPLQAEVKRRGLWACHLGEELGGQGYGQMKLALMNEILGRSSWAPTVFGTAAPDTGNAEILAMFGTAAQKARYLQPLLDGDIVSCYSMTEPQGGADPGVFTTRAVRDGDGWRIDGEKWFSSNARYASFLIVMCVTDPDVPLSRGASMFLVPAETPGIHIMRNPGVYGESPGRGAHGYIRYEGVRVGADAMLGGEGQGFAVAQARLGGGRVHHAMRTIGQCQKAIDMMGERALSRTTRGEPLWKQQTVRQYLADSYIELEQFRLLVLQTAWRIDRGHDYKSNLISIAAIKAAAPKIYQDIVQRAIQLHGSLGISDEMPLGQMLVYAASMGLVDGPTEVHKDVVARNLLKRYKPADGLFPSTHSVALREAAREKFKEQLQDMPQ